MILNSASVNVSEGLRGIPESPRQFIGRNKNKKVTNKLVVHWTRPKGGKISSQASWCNMNQGLWKSLSRPSSGKCMCINILASQEKL
jgi:hypothetical protein